MDDIHFSTGTDSWETPQYLFDKLNKEFNFEFDCCSDGINAKTTAWSSDLEHYVSIAEDFGFDCHFMNPPYSRGKQKKMVALAHKLFLMGKTVVCLLPARTDTKLFHQYIWDEKTHKTRTGVEMRLIKGRVIFERGGKPLLDKNDRPQPAPFPSMIVIFRG